MELLSQTYLAHYGILGMKWGVRRFQNHDGTLTPAGLERDRAANAAARKGKPTLQPVPAANGGLRRKASAQAVSTPSQSEVKRAATGVGEKLKGLATKENAKKVAVGAAIIGGTLLVAYGASHYSQISSVANELIQTGATSAQKALSSTATAANNTASTLKTLSEASNMVQEISKPEKNKSLKEEAAEKAATKITEAVGQKSKVAGIAVNTVAQQAVSKVGGNQKQSDYGLTLDPKESFSDAQMSQLLATVGKIGVATEMGSKAVGAIGNSSEQLAQELLKKLGSVRIY